MSEPSFDEIQAKRRELTLKGMFDKSRELWGLDAQILMLVEELNELSVASLHLLRNLKDKEKALEHFAEEIADVQFLIDEMLYYFKKQIISATTEETFFEAVIRYRKQKEKRLEYLLTK